MGKMDRCLDLVTQKVPKVEYEATNKCNHCIGISKYVLFVIPALVIIGIMFVPQWHHQQQPVEGVSVAKLKGTLNSTSGDLAMDVQDYTLNQNVPDSFFVATKLNVKAQNRSDGDGRWRATETWEDSLTGIEDLTVLIKNWAVFLGGGFQKKSIKWSNMNAFNASLIGTCRYNSTDEVNKYCPVFKIGTILEAAGQNSTTMSKGGVIEVEFNWECQACASEIKKCKPTIRIRRVDNIEVTEEQGGLNFRYANYYDRTSRDLIKATGIRFITITTGYGYSFDFIMLVLKVGGMLGYMSVVTFAAAFLMERFQKCSNGQDSYNQMDNIE